MSWQARTYLRLRDRGWYQIGALFEAIETEIPMHLAMRTAMQPCHGRTEMPVPTVARWRKFLDCLSAIGVETSGNPYRRKWQDEVRLRYVEGLVCGDCGGPVIKACWSAKLEGKKPAIACLACESAAAVKPQSVIEEPAHIQDYVVLPVRQPVDRIDEAAAYVLLDHMIAQWGPPIKTQVSGPLEPGAAGESPLLDG